MGTGHTPVLLLDWAQRLREAPARTGASHFSGGAPQEPLNVRVEETPNRTESIVDGFCQGSHSRGGSESNQGDNQNILDHALAFLLLVQPGEDANN